jgi:DNA invertase Pin-like site-specific DNA recombinase
VTRGTRPAAYIRIARDGGALTLASQRSAVCQAARSRGWAEPAVYLDVDEQGPAFARLTSAISTGQHDTLLIGLGTVLGLAGEVAGLLAGCARHGVAVECVTPCVTEAGGTRGSRAHRPA